MSTFPRPCGWLGKTHRQPGRRQTDTRGQLLMTTPRSGDHLEDSAGHQILDNAQPQESHDESLLSEIAALKAELARLSESSNERDRLATIIEASPDFVAIATPDGKAIFVNQAGRKLIGSDPEGAPLEDAISRIHPEWAARLIIEQGIPTAVREGVWRGESALLNASGAEHPVSQVIVSHHDEQGKLYISTIMRDIGDQKATESALMRSEQRYRNLVDSSPDAIFINQGGLFSYVNRAALRLFGARDAAELVGTPCLDRIHPDDRAMVRERIRLLTTERRAVPPAEQRYLRLDGSVVDVEVSAAPYSDDEETGMQVIVRDISERKAASRAMAELHRELEERVATRTAELSRALAEAERANSAKSDFLSRMSHELRTPLNAIIGFGQLLEQDLGDEEQVDSVREILHGGRHLLELINEVLDLSRIEAGKMTLSLEPVQLGPLLAECLVLIRPLAQAQSITVMAQEVECAVQLRADRVRLKQVLLNLLSNAVKYNREGGSVSVCCLNEDDALTIRISDTGAGMPAEHVARLFRPFERLGADEHSIEGTGIGLALSKRLMQLMGGTIGVDSKPGEGSTFWVRLPGCEPADGTGDAAEAGESSEPETDATRRKRKVLCIEDNPANLRLIERVLARRPDISVLSATTPGLGLQLAMSHMPELILLDINLPDIDGYDVMKCLRENAATQYIPVVAVSANAMPRDLARAQMAGFAEYVTKPIDIERLLAAVDKALSQTSGHASD